MSSSPSATSSSSRLAPAAAAAVRRVRLAALSVIFLALPVAGHPQTVDCVVAHVNLRAITLTDIRLLQALRIGEEVRPGEAAPTVEAVLERAIDRLVVVDLMRGNFPVPEEDLDRRLAALKGRFEPAAWQQLLGEFGISEDGIRSYLENLLQYERMLSVRFGQLPEVGIQEMQDYYDREYAPARTAAGLEPKPLGQALGQIEELLRTRKRESQISDWISGLRGQAEVRLHDECLANLR